MTQKYKYNFLIINHIKNPSTHKFYLLEIKFNKTIFYQMLNFFLNKLIFYY